MKGEHHKNSIFFSIFKSTFLISQLSVCEASFPWGRNNLLFQLNHDLQKDCSINTIRKNLFIFLTLVISLLSSYSTYVNMSSILLLHMKKSRAESLYSYSLSFCLSPEDQICFLHRLSCSQLDLTLMHSGLKNN